MAHRALRSHSYGDSCPVESHRDSVRDRDLCKDIKKYLYVGFISNFYFTVFYIGLLNVPLNI